MKKSLLFLLAAIPLVVFFGLRRNSAPFFSVKEYQCSCPEFISQDYFSSLTSLLAELLNEKCMAHELIDRLKKEFPLLNKVVVSYRPSATHIMLSAHEPVCCINNVSVLTDHNELVPKDCFSVTALVDIPKVEIFQEDMTNSSLFVASLLHQLPSDFNHFYNLEFMNEHYVRLVDKQEPHFVIALTVAQKKLPLLLAQCESVKKNIAARSGFDKGVKWIADARFAHYIVAYKT